MDFADILEQWETLSKNSSKEHKHKTPVKHKTNVTQEKHISDIDKWLRIYGIHDKDAETERISPEQERYTRHRYLKQLLPEARIDLHGLTEEEAQSRLNSFITDCVYKHLDKILIIHGKGNHSNSNPVLSRMVQTVIEKNPFLGESGHPSRENGGTGATWVILKHLTDK